MNQSTARDTKVPKRALPIYLSVPRDILEEAHQQNPSTTNTKRQSPTPASPQPAGVPWCTVPFESHPLTQHQQTVANQCIPDGPSSCFALVGPRGIGKSTTVAHLSQESSIPTLWLNAHSESTLRASYVSLLRQYAPQEKTLGTQSTRQLAELVARLVLSQPSSWRIVYDNVQVAPITLFMEWVIPTSSTAASSIWITSTLPAFLDWKQEDYQPIRMEAKLSLEDAQALLFSGTINLQPKQSQAVSSLLSLLDHLPLAVRIAGAHRQEMGLPLDDFVHQLQQYKSQFNQADQDDGLSWFWSFVLDEVVQEETSLRALQVLSMIHPECIPEALLKPYQPALLPLQRAIILQVREPQTYSVAPQLHQAIRQRVEPTNALAEAVKALQACLVTAKHKHAIHYMPHLETLKSHLPKSLPEDFPRESCANVLLQMGILLQRPPLADYARAMDTYRLGVEIGTGYPGVEKTLQYRLGTCARLQGDHPQAKAHCVKALALYGYNNLQEQASPPQLHHTENTDMSEWNILSQLFHTCGYASWQEGQVLEARVYFEYELAVKQAMYGADQPQDRVARTLNNLGSVCRDAGDLAAARDYGLKSLQMQKELGMGDNLETATTLNNLGSLSYSLCEYAQAQEFLEQALAMKQKCYNQQLNLDVGETYYNLGMLADHLSHYEKAQSYYEASLDCNYAVFGREAQNAQIATSLSSLGLSAMNQGQYKKAEKCFQQAIDMQRAFYQNQGNMEMVRTLHGLGMINYHLGRLQQSRQYHKQALEMQQEYEGKSKNLRRSRSQKSDPRTANLSQIMQNLGNLAHNLGEYDDAKEYYEQGLKLYSQVSVDSTKDEHLHHMLSNLESLSSTSSYDAARTYYKKALEMKEFVYGEGSANSDLAFTLRSLALLNDNAGNHEEAKENYEKALHMLHHFYGSKDAANAEIAGILDGLGTVNYNLGDYQESRSWLQQALTMKQTVYGDAKNNDLATSHVSLGTLAHTLGDYQRARQHLETAYAMQREVFGDAAGQQNIELGITANCLGNLYKDLGETDKALALYEQAMELMGQDNPFLASVLTDLGEFYREQAEYEKATACLQAAMKIQKHLYGEAAENAEIAALSVYLGKLYADMGKHEEAHKCLDSALQMHRGVIGEGSKIDEIESAEIADTLLALGELMLDKGDTHEALFYLEQSKNMREKVYGDVRTIEMAQTIHSLAEAYAGLNDEGNAKMCNDHLSELRSSAPKVTQVLNERLQRKEQAAAAKSTRLQTGGGNTGSKRDPVEQSEGAVVADEPIQEALPLESNECAPQQDEQKDQTMNSSAGGQQRSTGWVAPVAPNGNENNSGSNSCYAPTDNSQSAESDQSAPARSGNNDETGALDNKEGAATSAARLSAGQKAEKALAPASCSKKKSTVNEVDALMGTIVSVEHQQVDDTVTVDTAMSSAEDSTLHQVIQLEAIADKQSPPNTQAEQQSALVVGGATSASQESKLTAPPTAILPGEGEKPLGQVEGDTSPGSKQGGTVEVVPPIRQAGQGEDMPARCDGKEGVVAEEQTQVESPGGKLLTDKVTCPASDNLMNDNQSDSDPSQELHGDNAANAAIGLIVQEDKDIVVPRGEAAEKEEASAVLEGSAQLSDDPNNAVRGDSSPSLPTEEQSGADSESDANIEKGVDSPAPSGIIEAGIMNNENAPKAQKDPSIQAGNANDKHEDPSDSKKAGEKDAALELFSDTAVPRPSKGEEKEAESQSPDATAASEAGTGRPLSSAERSPLDASHSEDQAPNTKGEQVVAEGSPQPSTNSSEDAEHQTFERNEQQDSVCASTTSGPEDKTHSNDQVANVGRAASGAEGHVDSKPVDQRNSAAGDAENAADADTFLKEGEDPSADNSPATACPTSSAQGQETNENRRSPSSIGKDTNAAQRDASSRKLKSGRRSSLGQKQPGERPRMDWTDKKLVKRESIRYLQQTKRKEQENHDMDWTDKKLVKRESMRYLEQKKLEEQGPNNDSKPQPEKRATDSHQNRKDLKGNNNQKRTNMETKDATKPKLGKKSPSKANVTAKKEAKQKLEKRSRLKKSLQADEPKQMTQGKKANGMNKNEESKPVDPASKRQIPPKNSEANAAAKATKPTLQGKSRSKSKGLGEKAHSSNREEANDSSVGSKKGKAARKEAVKSKRPGDEGQSEEATTKTEVGGKQEELNSALTRIKQDNKGGTPLPAHEGKRKEPGVAAQAKDRKQKPKTDARKAAKKKQLDREDSSSNRSVSKRKAKKGNTDKGSSTRVEIQEQDKRLQENPEATSTAETDGSSMDDGQEGDSPRASERSGGASPQSPPQSNEREGLENRKPRGDKTQVPEPCGESENNGEERGKTDTTDPTGVQTDRGLLFEDPLDTSLMSTSSALSKQKKGENMSGVTDMPARKNQEEATTCGCWPFAWFN